MFFRRRPAATPVLGANSADHASPTGGGSGDPRSVIGRNTRFRGDVSGRGPLVIQGHVSGTLGIEDRLVIESGGSLAAEVRVTEAVIAGLAEGRLQVRDTLYVTSTGVLQGNIESGRIRVEEGGVLLGSLAHWKSAPDPQPPSQPADEN